MPHFGFHGLTLALGLAVFIRNLMSYQSFATSVAMLALLVSLDGAQPSDTNPPTPTITNFSQLRALSREDAAKGYPFHGKAVITFLDETICFAQDEKLGTYVGGVSTNAPWKIGDVIKADGYTDPGDNNPIIVVTNVQILARNQPLPTPKSLSLKALTTGKEDGLWVETEAVVYETAQDAKHLALKVGRSSITEMSIVSICGQNGKPRSEMTSVLVWRTRLSRSLISGLRIPVLSIAVFDTAGKAPPRPS